MDIVFTVLLGWFCISYASVCFQTKSYGAFFVFLGALATLFAMRLTIYRELAKILLLIGRVSFWGGLAILATFERDREIERLRNSSWASILLGRVPEHQRKEPLLGAVTIGCSVSTLLALFFFTIGDNSGAISCAVIALVFGVYEGCVRRKD
jgi:hypothetical protein